MWLVYVFPYVCASLCVCMGVYLLKSLHLCVCVCVSSTSMYCVYVSVHVHVSTVSTAVSALSYMYVCGTVCLCVSHVFTNWV